MNRLGKDKRYSDLSYSIKTSW